jgi:hypothetical protein
MKPGEWAMRWVKRSPLVRPNDSAYDAPSEKPAMATRLGSIE